MKHEIDRRTALQQLAGASVVIYAGGCATAPTVPDASEGIALVNARWFTGESFRNGTFYSVGGHFSERRPPVIHRVVDLAGTWVVPPLGDAHNHSIGTGVEEWDRRAAAKYLADGVFYAKMVGNLPISATQKERLGLNRPNGLDVTFGQGPLTASGGWPRFLIERVLLPRGYFPGQTPESLADYRYFTINSIEELRAKWPLIRAQRGDFIKLFLWFSDEFEQRRTMPQSGLDPRLVPDIVAMAHQDGLRVTAHVWNASDFSTAITSGVDEIAHLPPYGMIKSVDAEAAAQRGTVVVTTARLLRTLPPSELPKDELPRALERQVANLTLLNRSGVTLAVGSDDPADSSVREVEHLKSLSIFDNLTLLRMWSHNTPKAIFPGRRIGAFTVGNEASFIAVEGDPLQDLTSLQRIKVRFKQGTLLAAD